MLEEQAREVGMHTFVTADELIREGKSRHEAALLDPEYCRERAREEDALYGRESDKSLSK